MSDPLARRRRLAGFVLVLLLLNPPVLTVVDAIRLPHGVPLTPVYLLAVWLGAVAFAAVRARR